MLDATVMDQKIFVYNAARDNNLIALKVSLNLNIILENVTFCHQLSVLSINDSHFKSCTQRTTAHKKLQEKISENCGFVDGTPTNSDKKFVSLLETLLFNIGRNIY